MPTGVLFFTDTAII